MPVRPVYTFVVKLLSGAFLLPGQVWAAFALLIEVMLQKPAFAPAFRQGDNNARQNGQAKNNPKNLHGFNMGTGAGFRQGEAA